MKLSKALGAFESGELVPVKDIKFPMVCYETEQSRYIMGNLGLKVQGRIQKAEAI